VGAKTVLTLLLILTLTLRWVRRRILAQGSLVDEPLWDEIKTTYPELVAAVLRGFDISAHEVDGPAPVRLLANNGEINAEYKEILAANIRVRSVALSLSLSPPPLCVPVLAVGCTYTVS
jgi:hypothetical protein